jgi:hypothetical protein
MLLALDVVVMAVDRFARLLEFRQLAAQSCAQPTAST